MLLVKWVMVRHDTPLLQKLYNANTIKAKVDPYLSALSFLSDDFGKVDLGDEDGLAGVSDL